MVDECYALADKWAKAAQSASKGEQDFQPSEDDIKSWASQQTVVFLETLQKLPQPLPALLIRLMDKTYHLSISKNVELSSRFLVLGLKTKDQEWCAPAAELLGTVGRMKFVRPLYRHLRLVDEKLAKETFEKHRSFYHPICSGMVEKDLGLGGAKKV